jgi:hypothetical protein
MATRLCKVVGGEKGYVPVKSNSHGGLDVTKAYNDEIVQEIVSIPPEFGYAQVVRKVNWPVSGTGEYWIEKSHLEAVVEPEPEPEPEGEWEAYSYRLEDGKLFLKKL